MDMTSNVKENYNQLRTSKMGMENQMRHPCRTQNKDHNLVQSQASCSVGLGSPVALYKPITDPESQITENWPLGLYLFG